MKRLKQVWQFRRVVAIPPGAPRLNFLAALIGGLGIGILVLTFRATPAGAGLDTAATSVPLLKMSPQPAARADGSSDSPLAGLSADELNRRIHNAVHGSKLALELHIALLEVGKHRLDHIPHYSGTFIKQERVKDADLQDLQTIEFKMRHKPFSVYMKWVEGGDIGRQVLFVEGQYEDKLQVKLGGKKGSLLPVMKLEPDSSLAMKESRYPVTELGLMFLAEQVHKYRKRDLGLGKGVHWEMIPNQQFQDNVCDCWVLEYESREVEPIYRKVTTYIDRKLSLPVCVRNYGWPPEGMDTSDPAAVDEATLIEYYGYTNLHFEDQLSDADFDKANADYKFRR